MKAYDRRFYPLFFPILLASCGAQAPKDGRNPDVSAARQDLTKKAIQTPGNIVEGSGERAMKQKAASSASLTLPDCASLQSRTADEVSDLFEKHYPTALVDPGQVDEQLLSQDDLSAIVGFATCAAAKTDFDPFVADNASALFASKRHGTSAFAALEKHGAKSGFEGKAARDFADQMRNYAKDPTE